nr:MAG TPA: hypothetical protein [Caudoviricetes sp.]
MVRTSFIFEISIFFRQFSHKEPAIIELGGTSLWKKIKSLN